MLPSEGGSKHLPLRALVETSLRALLQGKHQCCVDALGVHRGRDCIPSPRYCRVRQSDTAVVFPLYSVPRELRKELRAKNKICGVRELVGLILRSRAPLLCVEQARIFIGGQTERKTGPIASRIRRSAMLCAAGSATLRCITWCRHRRGAQISTVAAFCTPNHKHTRTNTVCIHPRTSGGS